LKNGQLIRRAPDDVNDYMRDGALAKDTIPKGIPTWNLSLGIHGMDRRFPEAMFTMLNECYELR